MSIPLELLNKQNIKIPSLVTSNRLFPQTEEEADIIVTNVSLKEKKLNFDLDISNLDFVDYSAVKIMELTPNVASQLSSEGFPAKLTLKTQQLIFGNDKFTEAYEGSPLMEDINVTISDVNNEIYNVLIVLEDFPLVTSDIFLLQIGVLPQKSSNQEKYSNVFSKLELRTSPLKIKEGDTYTSNLLYSCNDDGILSGFYCVDLEKFVFDFAKFPNLLFGKNKSVIDQFIYKTEMFFYRYDSSKAGYNFANFVASAAASPVNNLAVNNSSPYRFYDLSINLQDKVSQMQAVAKIFFNDITINFAKQTLKTLITAKNSGDRILAVDSISDIYDDEFEKNFNYELNELLKISNIEFDRQCCTTTNKRYK